LTKRGEQSIIFFDKRRATVMKKLFYSAVIFCFVALLVAPAPAASNDSSKEILKDGLLGAVTGAVAADQSGGKAGKGALIGAGTNVIGGAVLDSVFGGGQQQTTTATPQPIYAPQTQQQAPVVYAPPVQTQDTNAQAWYQRGYQDGFKAGYQEGLNAQRPVVIPSRE
jgi:hypothetical protein